MRILDTQIDVGFLPKPNICEVIATDQLPNLKECSAAYVLVIVEDHILLAKQDRGIDIPGGHLDEGEDVYGAMVRETKEETGVTIKSAQLCAVQKMVLTCSKPVPYNYPYPTSYQVFYFSDDVEIGEFTEDEDSDGPVWIAIDDLQDIAWFQKNQKLFAEVLKVCKSAKSKAKDLKPNIG